MADNRQHRRRRPHNGGRSFGGDDDEERHHQSQSQTQRRRQAAISLASFSSKKGHDRALQEYKKRKETKFHKNAALLREYQRAMRQEGYDAGRGASRKRGGDADGGGRGKKRSSRDDSDGDEGDTGDIKADDGTRKKRHKSDPLREARKKAEERKAEQQAAMSQREKRQQEEGKKQQNRKVRARKMMQRTRKGQPLMKNVIGDLLGKIKSDVGEGA